MAECKWTREICAQLERYNTLIFPVVASRMQKPGWPDRFIAHTQWQGWLEFKDYKTPVSRLQKKVLRELRLRNKRLAYIVRRPDRIEDERGNLLGHFDGTGLGLLKELIRCDSQ